jgi:glycosyltransferase involved in cell wall biosynthesis
MCVHFFGLATPLPSASAYETFSLVVVEAGAASLVLITRLLHGVGEIVSDRQTGYVVRRTVEDLASVLMQFLKLKAQERIEMGRRARLEAMNYNEERFVANWRRFYNEWGAEGKCDWRVSKVSTLR